MGLSLARTVGCLPLPPFLHLSLLLDPLELSQLLIGDDGTAAADNNAAPAKGKGRKEARGKKQQSARKRRRTESGAAWHGRFELDVPTDTFLFVGVEEGTELQPLLLSTGHGTHRIPIPAAKDLIGSSILVEGLFRLDGSLQRTNRIRALIQAAD